VSIFRFGDLFLKDKPTVVLLHMKDGTTRGYAINDDHGMLLNPGEPISYLNTFLLPKETANPNVTANTDRHIRIVEIITWDLIARVTFEYKSLEETDPAVFEPTPARAAGVTKAVN
jgi:hypothetical protein